MLCIRAYVSSVDDKSLEIDAYLVAFRSLGFDFLLGMKGIKGLGGITINAAGSVSFSGQKER